MSNNETKITYNEPAKANNEVQSFSGLQGIVRVVSSVPDWTPRNLEESICIYTNGSTVRWYAFNFEDKTWEKFTNTTIAKDGSTALEGDATLSAGQGISLAQVSNDIEISTEGEFYFGNTVQTQTISVGSPHDTTITCGFEPRMVIFWGWFNNNSTPPSALPAYVATGGASGTDTFFPMFWKADGTYLGIDFGEGAGTSSPQFISDALSEAEDSVSQAKVTVRDTTSTSFDIRMEIQWESVPSSHDYKWNYQYLVFG